MVGATDNVRAIFGFLQGFCGFLEHFGVCGCAVVLVPVARVEPVC